MVNDGVFNKGMCIASAVRMCAENEGRAPRSIDGFERRSVGIFIECVLGCGGRIQMWTCIVSVWFSWTP